MVDQDFAICCGVDEEKYFDKKGQAAAVRSALSDGQEVAFATRHQWRRYHKRKPQYTVLKERSRGLLSCVHEDV